MVAQWLPKMGEGEKGMGNSKRYKVSVFPVKIILEMDGGDNCAVLMFIVSLNYTHRIS